jgi:protein TonB
MSAVEAESTSKTVVNSTPARTEAVTPPQYRAAYLQNPKPEMPYLSKVKGESGRVGLRVKVGIHGEPLLVRIEQSSGFSRLDNAAYQTVLEKWRFVPAKMGDTPIEGEVAFGIPFILTSE